MALKFFRIPVAGSVVMEAELNAFLAGHKVLRVTRELVERETAPGWAVCVDFLEGGSVPSSSARGKGGGSKVDYREVLNGEDFALFAKLREQRKQLAEKEGVPVYAVFTNEQLAQMAKERPQSRTALGCLRRSWAGVSPAEARGSLRGAPFVPGAASFSRRGWWCFRAARAGVSPAKARGSFARGSRSVALQPPNLLTL